MTVKRSTSLLSLEPSQKQINSSTIFYVSEEIIYLINLSAYLLKGPTKNNYWTQLLGGFEIDIITLTLASIKLQ